MPIYDPAKRQRFVELGLNPDEYDDPNYGEQTPTNVSTEQQSPTKNAPSKLTSLRQELIRSAPAAAIGIKAASAVAPLTAPIPGVNIIAPLAVGAIAAAGSKMLQDKAFETLAPTEMAKEYTETQQQNFQENPVTSMVGSSLGGLPLLKPSPTVLKEAGRGVSKIIRPSTITPVEKAAIGNIGIGAAVGPAITYGREAISQGTPLPSLNPKELLVDLVTGGMLHQPTKLGKSIGLTSIEAPNDVKKGEGKRYSGKDVRTRDTDEPNTSINTIAPGEELTPRGRVASGLGEYTFKENKKGEAIGAKIDVPMEGTEVGAMRKINKEIEKQNKEKELQKKALAIEEKKMAKALTEGKLLQAEINYAKSKFAKAGMDEKYWDTLPEEDKIRAINEIREANKLAEENKLVDTQKPVDKSVDDGDITYTKSPEEQYIDEAELPIGGKAPNTDSNTIPRKKTLPLLNEVPVKYIGSQETGVPNKPAVKLYNVLEDVKGTNIKKGSTVTAQSLNKAGYKIKVMEQESSSGLRMESEKLAGPKITKVFTERMKQLGLLRGVKIDDTGKVIGANGQEIKGNVDVIKEAFNEVTARVNLRRADADTYPHEILHKWWQVLGESPNKKDREIHAKAQNVISRSKEFSNWIKDLPADSNYRKLTPSQQIEEFIVSGSGKDFTRKLFSTDNKSNLSYAFSEIKSYIKHKLNRADAKDYVNMLSAKLFEDAPISALRPKDSSKSVDVTDVKEGAKEQEGDEFVGGSDINKGEDLAIINTLTGELVKSGRKNFVDLETQKRWTESIDRKILERIASKYNIDANEVGLYEVVDLNKIQDGPLEKFGDKLSEEGVKAQLQFAKNASELDSKFRAGGDEADVLNNAIEMEKAVAAQAKIQKNSNEVFPEDVRKNQEDNTPEIKWLSKEDSSAAKDSPVEESRMIEETAGWKKLIPTRSDLDRIREMDIPEARTFADAFESFEQKLTRFRGEYVNKFQNKLRSVIQLDGLVNNIKNHKDYIKQNTPELSNLVEYLYKKNYGIDVSDLTPPRDELLSTHQELTKLVRYESNKRQHIKHKNDSYNENYIPEMVDPNVLKVLKDSPNSPAAKQYEKDFIEHYKKFDKDKSRTPEEAWKTFLDGFSKNDINIAKQYGPLDKAEGVGLPYSMINKNYMDVMGRYGDRVSRRFAYHDVFEVNPKNVEAYEKIKRNDRVQSVYSDITGNKFYENPKLTTFLGLVRSLKLQTLTGTVDAVTAPFFTAQHFENPFKWTAATINSWKNLRNNIADAWDTGTIRRHMSALEMDNGVDDLLNKVKRARDIISDVTARNFLDQIARGQTMGIGKWAAIDYFEQHKNGKLSKQGEKFFEDFAKDIDWKNAEELTNEQVKEIASRFVEANQGTYDSRGLPRAAIEGGYAPLLSIARWSIEKSNNFIKYAIEPATKGNWTPLLMSFFGMTLGGAAANGIRELLTGRKQKTPTFKELESEYSNMGLAYKMMGMFSAAGHIGMLGDLIKSSLDVTYGKNRPQTINNILVEGLENMTTTTLNFVGAAVTEGISDELVTAYMDQILNDNLQNYRLLSGFLSAKTKEDIDRANKFRDLRVFNTLAGNGISDLRTTFTEDFSDLDMKRFKRTNDPKEAAELLPELINKAIERADGNPERLRRELSKIKRNSYQTMPNPETMPESFTKYLLHLEKTQGKEKAQERLLDYIQRNELNKFKSKSVPRQ
jgi:hypothetical protein